MGFCIFYTITLQAGCKFSLPKQAVSCHSPCRCLVYILQAHVGFFKIGCFNLYLSWGFIPSLSKQVVNSHSPNRCWLFQFFLFFMGFHIVYTNTLQAGLRFMLSMQMFGLHSPSRCWLFLNSSMFHRISYFSYSQSPCRCLVNTLSLDIDVFIIQHFSYGFIFLCSHFPSRL